MFGLCISYHRLPNQHLPPSYKKHLLLANHVHFANLPAGVEESIIKTPVESHCV